MRCIQMKRYTDMENRPSVHKNTLATLRHGRAGAVFSRPNIPSSYTGSLSTTSMYSRHMSSERGEQAFASTVGGARPKHLSNPGCHVDRPGPSTAACEIKPATDSVMYDRKTNQMTVNIYYEVHGIKRTWKTDERFDCDILEYMKWKYVTKSASEISRCNDQWRIEYGDKSQIGHYKKGHLSSSSGENVQFQKESLVIGFKVINKEHARRTAEDALKFVFNEHELLVETRVLNKTRLEKAEETIKMKLDLKDVYVEAIDCKLYVVFREPYKDHVQRELRALEAYTNKYPTEKRVQLKKNFSMFTEIIANTLSNGVPSLTIAFDENPESFFCLLTGAEELVINAEYKLKSIETKLKERKVMFKTATNEALRELSVVNEVNNLLKHSECVAEQRGNELILHGFDETKLSRACLVIECNIIERTTAALVGYTTENRKNIELHFRTKYKDRIAVSIDRSCQLTFVGFKAAVDEAIREFVDIIEGRISTIPTASFRNPEQVVEPYPIHRIIAARFMSQSDILKNIEKKYQVIIIMHQKKYCIEIKGSGKNVNDAVESIRKVDKSICTDSVVVSEKKTVSYFKTENSKLFMTSIKNSCDVLLEKEVAYSTVEETVTKQVFDENIIWTDSYGRKLVLEKNTFHGAQSAIKVMPVLTNTGGSGGHVMYSEEIEKTLLLSIKSVLHSFAHSTSGKSFVRDGNVVKMVFPDEISRKQSAGRCLEGLTTSLITEVSETKEKSVALPLVSVGKWTFQECMKGFVDSSVYWLLNGPDVQPSTVLLYTDSQDYFASTDAYIEKRLLDLMKAGRTGCRRPEISIVNGHLDQTEADVLVNTTAPNLDLSYGKVTAALLKEAGPGIQQECKRKYPNGITQSFIAVTGGHNLRCNNVFHITLPVYNNNVKDGIKNIRETMLRSLRKASDYKYATIAFPAIGTGMLRYPHDIVCSEMIGSVARFKRECPDTTIKEIKFVIIEKDVDLYKRFERYLGKAETDMHEAQAKSIHQCIVKVNIIGMPENVRIAKKKLEFKVKEMQMTVDDFITEVITAVSRTVFSSVTEQYRKELDMFREDGVEILHNESKDEVVLRGMRGRVANALVSVRPFYEKMKGMQSSEFRINNLNEMRVEEEMDTSENRIVYPESEALFQKPGVKREFSWSQDASNIEIFERGNLVIRVYKANILDIPVEAIVNAANQDLNHCGGVAKEIAKAAGDSLLRECDTAIRMNNGPLSVASIVSTNAGNLKFKHVIHAVGPCWSDYTRTEADLQKCFQGLKLTVFNCFEEAEHLKLASIGMPTISSGIFKVPKEVCAVQYASAILEFSCRCKVLSEIHIVDYNIEMIEIMHKTFSVMIREGKPSPFNLSIYMNKSTKTGRGQGNEEPEKGQNKISKWTARDRPSYLTKQDNSRTDVAYKSDKDTLVCTFSSSYEVHVFAADILQLEDIDVVVCSERCKGDAKGTVSKALLEIGGRTYKRSKTEQFQSQRKVGEVVTTEGGKNRYKWVMHAVVARHDQKLLPDIYRNIFQEAEMREFRSMALSLLGTGDFGPVDSTLVLFAEWIRFCKETEKSAFLLHIVCNDTTIADIVKDVFKRCISEMNGLTAGDGTVPQDQISQNDDKMQHSTETVGEDCVICMDKVTNAEKLKCGHVFCKECIDGYFRVKKVCPTCGTVCGIITGDQPDGRMDIVKRFSQVAGFEKYKSIAITYRFEDGTQGSDHPRPGSPYNGITRTAYLPDNKEGREICALLKIAFERRLVFTIGTSRTTGKECVITWNDIHHKTDPRPNTQFGYPDKTYLQRVREELEVKGATVQDIEKQLIKDLEKDTFRQSFTTGN